MTSCTPPRNPARYSIITLLAATLGLLAGCGSDEQPAAGGDGTGGVPGAAGAAGAAGEEGAGPLPLAPWDGTDDVAPSAEPPDGLSPAEVPMFVALGWDDNGYSGLPGSNGDGGVSWATDMVAGRTNPAGTGQAETYDGSPVRMTFYMTTSYIENSYTDNATYAKRAWHTAYEDGHEIGNHTHLHAHGGAFPEETWNAQLVICSNWLTKPFDPDESPDAPDSSTGVGVPASEIYGFRTPFLEYNDALFTVLKDMGFWYDCSIEEGYQAEQDGTNYFWPYTLDEGSPAAPAITSHPGLWEMPVHAAIVPPDDQCDAYGVQPGLRARLSSVDASLSADTGKVTGLDYNMWVDFDMTKDEFVATLKYTLDLRLQGNRAPMMFGGHTDLYASANTYAENDTANSTYTQRQEAIEEFLDYALSQPQVRVVSVKQILDWIRRPVALE